MDLAKSKFRLVAVLSSIVEAMARVDFIVPLFNQASFVSLAMKSIVDQTFRDWRLILVDDASTDASLELAVRYTDLSRTLVIKNATNQGLSSSLNHALRYSDAEFIARFDPDDINLPSRLENQLNLFANDKTINAVSSPVQSVDAYGNKTRNFSYKDLDACEVKALLLLVNPICHPTVLIKRESIHDFQYIDGQSQDYRTWLNYHETVNWKVMKSPQVIWREHQNNLSKELHNLPNIFIDAKKRILENMNIEATERAINVFDRLVLIEDVQTLMEVRQLVDGIRLISPAASFQRNLAYTYDSVLLYNVKRAPRRMAPVLLSEIRIRRIGREILLRSVF